MQSVKEKLDVYGKTFFDDICGMTPLQYRDYVQKVYEQKLHAIDADATISVATRTLAHSYLSMNYASALFDFKGNIAMAPMVVARKECDVPT